MTKMFVFVGLPQNDLSGLSQSRESADRVSWDRLTHAYSDVIYARDLPKEAENAQPLLTIAERGALDAVVEGMRVEEIDKEISLLFAAHAEQLSSRPYLCERFSNELMVQLFNVLYTLNVSVDNAEKVRLEFEETMNTICTADALKSAIAKIFTREINAKLKEKKDNASVYIQQTKEYVELHCGEEIVLKQIADELHINPVYLSMLFKDETGMNYSAYLTSVRMERAKKLLRKKEMNMSQIANAVGYQSSFYFKSLFMKTTGLTPSEYRRLHQNKVDSHA